MFDREILFELYDNYKAEYHDITEFVFGKFQSEGESVYRHIRETLSYLSSEKLVIFQNSDYALIGNFAAMQSRFPSDNELIGFKKFRERNLHIMAKITMDGKKEVEELKFQETAQETNTSFKNLNDVVLPRNFDDQRKIGNRTLIAIAASALFSLASVITALTLQDKQTPLLLEQQVKSLDSLKQSVQRIDTSLKNLSDSLAHIKITISPNHH